MEPTLAWQLGLKQEQLHLRKMISLGSAGCKWWQLAAVEGGLAVVREGGLLPSQSPVRRPLQGTVRVSQLLLCRL